MPQQTLPLPFDKTLTAENARQRGYEFVCESLATTNFYARYVKEAQIRAMQENAL